MNEAFSVAFSVPGRPVAKGRPRFSVHGKMVYTPPETVAYEKTVALFARQAMGAKKPVAVVPLRVYMTIYFPTPGKWSKTKVAAAGDTVHHATRPDLDNVIKAIADAGNGIIWIDDAQISELHTVKKYSPSPRVEILVESIGMPRRS